MQDIDFKPKVNALIANLPAYLKDHANYEKIERAIYDGLTGSCNSHNDITEWAGCGKCQMAFHNRSEVIRKLGFSSMAQYMAWKKIHETIKERVPFPKYNSK